MHMLARQAGAWRVAVLMICIHMQLTYGQAWPSAADRRSRLNHACIHVRNALRIHFATNHRDVSASAYFLGYVTSSPFQAWIPLEEKHGL